MPATYENIATTTLGSNASTISFSGIPQTYTDLVLVTVFRGAVAGGTTFMRFNDATGDVYSDVRLSGDGSVAFSNRSTSEVYIKLEDTGFSNTIPFFVKAEIFSYTNSIFKTCLTNMASDRNTSGTVAASCGQWRNTAAINKITLQNSMGNNFAAGSTATLYGILRA